MVISFSELGLGLGLGLGLYENFYTSTTKYLNNITSKNKVS